MDERWLYVIRSCEDERWPCVTFRWLTEVLVAACHYIQLRVGVMVYCLYRWLRRGVAVTCHLKGAQRSSSDRLSLKGSSKNQSSDLKFLLTAKKEQWWLCVFIDSSEVEGWSRVLDKTRGASMSLKGGAQRSGGRMTQGAQRSGGRMSLKGAQRRSCDCMSLWGAQRRSGDHIIGCSEEWWPHFQTAPIHKDIHSFSPQKRKVLCFGVTGSSFEITGLVHMNNLLFKV